MNFNSILNSADWHAAVSTNWEKIAALTSGFLTVFIAAIAVYVAYQQHVTNKRQLRLALFEKRLAVYGAMMKLRGLVLAKGDVNFNQLLDYIQETREHQFLFGEDVADYVGQIYDHAVKVWNTGQPQTFVEPATAARATEWFVQQEKVVREKFLRYMDFTEP